MRLFWGPEQYHISEISRNECRSCVCATDLSCGMISELLYLYSFISMCFGVIDSMIHS